MDVNKEVWAPRGLEPPAPTKPRRRPKPKVAKPEPDEVEDNGD